MKKVSIAKKYARAFFQIAVQQGVKYKTYQDVLYIQNIFFKCKSLLVMLQTPTIHNKVKQKCLVDILKKDVHQYTFLFLNIILEKKAAKLFSEILKEYIELYHQQTGIQDVYLTTAIPLNEEFEKEIQSFLIKKLQVKEVNLIHQVKKNILGGFLLQVDDKQLDETIVNKLHKVQKKIQHAIL